MAVKVRERPAGSGKWWIYVDFKGKRSARYIRQGKRRADEIAAKITEKLGILEAAKRNGIEVSLKQVVLDDPNRIVKDPEPKGPTLKEYAERWLKEIEAKGLKHTTQRSYKGILETHLYPGMGNLPLPEIDRKTVKALALKKLGEGTSTNTVRLILCTLSTLFSSAMEDELVAHNPALRPGKFMKMKGRRDDIDPLTREEEVFFLDKTAEHYPAYYPLFFFLLRTGCRIGEAVALQPGDLDFRGRFIEIRRNYTNGRITTPKSGKIRRVDMSLKLSEVLREHLTGLEVEAMAKGNPRPETVFPAPEGGILDPDNLRSRVFYKIFEKTGMREIRIHDLRHTFCTRLIENGESLAYVRDQMGHSSIQVTVDLYGHLVPGSNKRAVDRLDEPMEDPKTGGKSATIRNQEGGKNSGRALLGAKAVDFAGAGGQD